MINICYRCKKWEECFKYRYGNRPQEYMKKYTTEPDSWGQQVVYVKKCDNFERDYRPQ